MIPLYNVYFRSIHDDIYTENEEEYETLLSQGAVDYGIRGYMYANAIGIDNNALPFYRMYNQNLQDHFYTTSETERNTAASNGYVLQYIVGYILP